MPEKALLQMRGIRKSFPGVVALDDVSLDVAAGEVHVVLGENGAGKSTLIKILSGAYAKDAGDIRIEGASVEIRNPREARRLGISTIYQEPTPIFNLSAGENIFLGREPVRLGGLIDRLRLDREAQAVLDRLGVSIDARTSVARLSVAERQIVEVAKALSIDARIVIMDEPTAALTQRESERLFDAIRRLTQRGVGIIYISHRLAELCRIGDRVTVLRDGRYVGTHQVGAVAISELVRLMADRELSEHFPKEVVPAGAELMSVSNLTRGHKLRNVRFCLHEGEVLGVAGLVGAGRTELARALFGVDPIDSGEIRLRGRRVHIRSPSDALRHGMGFLTEDRQKEGLVLPMSLQNNIGLASLDRLSRVGWIDEAAERKLATHFVDRLAIKATGTDELVAHLSGGNQQKVVLARWLARGADILLFDEPTRGIDVGAKVEIYRLMNALTAEGVGILMISSELPEILGMSDRILVMREGAIEGELARGEANQEKILALALGHR
jgi:ribose transport system ATP-binding protein